MILSFRHRFIFVRARKVAGTSVEMLLSTVCGDDDIVPPMIAIDERMRQQIGGFSGNYSDHPAAEKLYAKAVLQVGDSLLGKLHPPPSRYTAHMTLAEISAISGTLPDGFRVIGIERNPYARMISFLHMKEHLEAYQHGRGMPGEPGQLSRSLERSRAAGGLPALKSAQSYGDCVPEILRYETLDLDLAGLSNSLGVTFPPLPHAKRGTMSATLDPQAIFTRAQLDWINSYFAEEFAAFGYETV